MLWLCSSIPYCTKYWPECTRVVMLAFWICQRKAITASYKWKDESSRLNRKRKKYVLSLQRCSLRINFCLWHCEEGKGNFCLFTVIHQTAKVMATILDEFLVKMEKALNLYKIFWKRPHSHFIAVYCYNCSVSYCCWSLTMPNLSI